LTERLGGTRRSINSPQIDGRKNKRAIQQKKSETNEGARPQTTQHTKTTHKKKKVRRGIPGGKSGKKKGGKEKIFKRSGKGSHCGGPTEVPEDLQTKECQKRQDRSRVN